MVTIQGQASSGSDGDPRVAAVIDDRKRKRMLSNRESARRSRMKKQQRLDELMGEVNHLRNENRQIMEKVNGAKQLHADFDLANNVLRCEVMNLTNRLRVLNEVLYIAEQVSGIDMDIPEIPDPLMEPWQLPRPVPSIVASSSTLFHR